MHGLRYKLLSATMPGEGTDFCMLEVTMTAHFHSNRGLGNFDKESKHCGGLKGKSRKGVSKSSLAFMILLEKGNLL